jgi:hypothetical protein
VCHSPRNHLPHRGQVATRRLATAPVGAGLPVRRWGSGVAGRSERTYTPLAALEAAVDGADIDFELRLVAQHDTQLRPAA